MDQVGNFLEFVSWKRYCISIKIKQDTKSCALGAGWTNVSGGLGQLERERFCHVSKLLEQKRAVLFRADTNTVVHVSDSKIIAAEAWSTAATGQARIWSVGCRLQLCPIYPADGVRCGLCFHTCPSVAEGEHPVNVDVPLPLDDEVDGLAWVDIQLPIKTRKIILEHDDARPWVLLFAELDALDDFLDSWQMYLVLLTSVGLSWYPVVNTVQFSITTL